MSEILEPWGRDLVGVRPRQPSDISDDGFPLEFSLTLTGGEPEVRVLFEPQAREEGPAARWAAAQALHTRLGREPGVDLTRLSAIAPLFVPGPTARWSAWHSVRFSRQQAPKFKVYLNPEARGAERASECVGEALRRLGFGQRAATVSVRREANQELKFFSLDLEADERARVKVYTMHQHATRTSIARALTAAPSFSQAVFDEFWSIVAVDEGPFSKLPISTYVALTSGDTAPSSATVHFPTRSYADDDCVVRERVCRLLAPRDLEVYRLALAGFARRPLEEGSGMHAYVALGQERGQSRVTIYLATEIYALMSGASAIRRISPILARREERP